MGEEQERIVYASVLYIKQSLEEKYEDEDFIHGNDPASIKSRPEMSLLYSLSQSVVQWKFIQCAFFSEVCNFFDKAM